jgi:hypothetical protein
MSTVLSACGLCRRSIFVPLFFTAARGLRELYLVEVIAPKYLVPCKIVVDSQ